MVDFFREIRIGPFIFWLIFIISLLIALTAIIGLAVDGLNIAWAFGEGDPLTWLSALLLLSAAFICRAIWKEGPSKGTKDWSRQGSLWRALYYGFVFLALDDLFRIHENIDNWLHKLAGVKPSAITDHVDDLLIGVYGLIGIYTLWRYRKEAVKLINNWKIFLAAAVCAFFTVVLDLIGNSKDFLNEILGSPELTNKSIMLINVVEESFKLYGEAFFVVAFFAVYQLYFKSFQAG